MSALLLIGGWLLYILAAGAAFVAFFAFAIARDDGGEAWAWFALFLLAAPSLLVGGLAMHNNVETGEGSETGYITAVQHEGAVWPTPDLFFKTDTNNSETYQYCLPKGDAALYEQAQELAKSRTFVRIRYEERFLWFPWQCNNGPMVKSFEVLA